VHLLGRRSDIGELLGQSNLFVLSTTPQEGLGSVLIEAMAAGLPIVATDVPACREVLANGRYGVLAPPKNPQALADAIVAAFAHAKDISAGVRQFAMNLTPQRMMNEYLNHAGFHES
jgi:glycosyltransferase involved in cell wall biosynthesis